MTIIRADNLQEFPAVQLLSDGGAVGGKVKIPNAVQVRFRWQIATAKVAVNVLYGRTGGVPAPTVAQAQAIFAALSTGAQWTALAALLGNTGGFLGVDLRSVHDVDLPIFSSTGALVPGTSATQPLPNEVAIVATFRTAKAGRSGRGRMYVPGWTVDSLATGQLIAAATMTALGNWLNTIQGALSAQGYTHCLGLKERKAYNGSTGTSHPARAATTEPVTAIVLRDNHWDTQRRRGLK
jgi:hypothetical protein